MKFVQCDKIWLLFWRVLQAQPCDPAKPDIGISSNLSKFIDKFLQASVSQVMWPHSLMFQKRLVHVSEHLWWSYNRVLERSLPLNDIYSRLSEHTEPAIRGACTYTCPGNALSCYVAWVEYGCCGLWKLFIIVLGNTPNVCQAVRWPLDVFPLLAGIHLTLSRGKVAGVPFKGNGG